jgi:quinolinate synthase
MFSEEEIFSETERLHEKLANAGFNSGYCRIIAPLTLEINRLKKDKNAVILAHSYQTPDIIYGVADFMGDSFELSKKAKDSDAGLIIFCGVRFMAETAKILSKDKTIVLPSADAGCSLADSITANDVRAMKANHPGRPVVTYINTSSGVKAESDVICTSANALKIIESLPEDEIIFLPDELMAKNLRNLTKKKIIGWKGRCIVHEDFKPQKIKLFKDKFPGLKVLAHTECDPDVVKASDFTGGTGGMIKYIKDTDASSYMLVTECGLNDRMRVEFPDKQFIGMCGLCPFMKQTTLPVILQTLKNPSHGQIIEVPEEIRARAEKSLNKMFELTNK